MRFSRRSLLRAYLQQVPDGLGSFTVIVVGLDVGHRSTSMLELCTMVFFPFAEAGNLEYTACLRGTGSVRARRADGADVGYVGRF